MKITTAEAPDADAEILDLLTGTLWSEHSNGTVLVLRVDDFDGAYAYCTALTGETVGTRWQQFRVQPSHFGRSIFPYAGVKYRYAGTVSDLILAVVRD